MDKVLHPERGAGRGANRHKPTFTPAFGSFPDGVMFHLLEGDPGALLKWKGRVCAWTPERYQEGPRMDQGLRVEILTPRRVVEMIGARYVPGCMGWWG